MTVKLWNFHTVFCTSVFALELKKLADLPTKSISILISLFHEIIFSMRVNFLFFHTALKKWEIYYHWYPIHWKILPEIHSFVTIMKSMFLKKVWEWIFVQYPLCSRYFQNVKLSLDFVESLILLPPLQFYVKTDFGDFRRSKNVIFCNLMASELWTLVNLGLENCSNLL